MTELKKDSIEYLNSDESMIMNYSIEKHSDDNLDLLMEGMNKIKIENSDEDIESIDPETVEKLEKLLTESLIDHKKLILNEKTLKNAHIYCNLHHLSGQVTGLIIENYIKTKYELVKVSASTCKGDLEINKNFVEIKE